MPAFTLRTVLLVMLWAAHYSPSSCGEPLQNAQPAIEITQVDLFSLKGWDSSQVAFFDFRLGMRRNEAFRNAQNQELTMDDDSGQGCLKAASCHVLKSGGYIGLSLSFGVSDSIQRITIVMPSSSGSKGEKEDWVVTKLRGQTRELFENYSDSLRARLLGIANANWFDAPRGMPPYDGHTIDGHTIQEYQYYSKGLILHVRSKATKPSKMPQKTQVTAEFLFPK